jgi:phytanoyl-CoA hydroxylase
LFICVLCGVFFTFLTTHSFNVEFGTRSDVAHAKGGRFNRRLQNQQHHPQQHTHHAFGDGGSLSLDALTADQWYDWNENGFLLIRGFYDAGIVTTLKDVYEDAWTSRLNPAHPASRLTIDILDSGKRLMFKDVSPSERNKPYKLNDLYLAYPAIQNTVISGKISVVLEALLDAPPVVCNSLTFEYGSQQPDHFDTWYMPSRVQNGMVASWIAIDPVTDTNGPLRYYPGSHKIKPFAMNPDGITLQQRILSTKDEAKMPLFREYISQELMKHEISKPVVFHAEPGDLLIWHSQLFHGGMPILDNFNTTRKSLVTHYHSTKDYVKGSHELVRVQPGTGFYRRKQVLV